MKATGGGVSWYRREDYPLLLKIFEDADKLPPAYDDWLAMAEKAIETIESTGLRAVRVIIDPYEFPTWCAANGHKVNAKARLAYGNWMVMKAVHDN